jgi:serine/threonine protein kinase
MRELSLCANTLKLYKIYESDKYINLLLEYHEGGTLAEKLERQVRFTEDEARLIAAQLLLTVDFMQRKGIIHRDLKPENLLLNTKKDYDIRVADFGFVTTFDTSMPYEISADKSVCGTAAFIAPEAFEGKGYTSKSDVFSIGSILFSVLTLKNLFKGADYKHTLDLNRECKIPDLNIIAKGRSTEAKDLLY